MVAIRRLDCTTGESHLVTVPVPDEQRTAVETMAANLDHDDHPSDTVYFVVELPATR